MKLGLKVLVFLKNFLLVDYKVLESKEPFREARIVDSVGYLIKSSFDFDALLVYFTHVDIVL